MDRRNKMGPYILHYQHLADWAGRKFVESSNSYWLQLQMQYIQEIDKIKHQILEHEKLNPPK